MQTGDDGEPWNKEQDQRSSVRARIGARSEMGNQKRKGGTWGGVRSWGQGNGECCHSCGQEVPGAVGQRPEQNPQVMERKGRLRSVRVTETAPCGLVVTSPSGRDTCVVFINIYLLRQLFSPQETIFSLYSQGLTMNINIRLPWTRGTSQKAWADFLVSV